MTDQTQNLKNRIFKGKKNKNNLSPIIKLIRELGCITDIIGEVYEIFDDKGKLVYTVKKRTITPRQLYNFVDELNELEKVETQSNKNFGKPKRGKK